MFKSMRVVTRLALSLGAACRGAPVSEQAISSFAAGGHHIECLDRFAQTNTNSFRASLLLSTLVVLGLWNLLPHEGLLIWLFTVWMVQTAHEAYSRYYLRHRGTRDREYRRWLPGFWLAAAVVGACWSSPFYIFHPLSDDAALLLVFSIAGVTAYGGVARATVLSVALIFECATVLPMGVWLFQQGSAVHRIMGVTSLLYLLMLTPLLRKMNQMVTRTLWLGDENQRLSSEQKRYLEKLHRSEEEYRTLASNMPVAVIRYDAEQRRRYINPAAERMLHGQAGKMLGQLPGEGGVPATPAMIERYRNVMTDVLETGEIREFEFVLDALPEGAHEHYQIRMAPEHGEDGRVSGALATWFDVTERKRMEEELRLKEQVLDHAHDGIYLIDERARFVYVNDEACRALGYSREELLGMGVPDVDHAYSVEDSNAVDRQTREDGPFAFQTQHRRRDGSLLPVEIQASALEYQGRHLGLAVVRDISERKQAEASLEASNALLRNVLQGIPDPVWMKDAEGAFVVCNQGVARLFNMPVERIIGKDDYDFFPPEQAEFYRNKDRSALEAGQVLVNEEWWTFTDNGEQVLMETRKTPVRSPDGRLLGVLGVARDITERKKIQQRLEVLDLAVNQVSDALFVQDDTLRFVNVNEAACRSLGYSREELTRMSTPDIDPNFTREELVRAFVTAELGKSSSFESCHRTKDGRIIPVEITGTFFEIDGVRHVVTMARDISERKHAEAALEASNALLRNVLQGIPDPVWMKDAEGAFVVCNQGVARLFNMPVDEIVGKDDYDFFPPEQAEFYRNKDRSALEAGQVLINEEWWTFADNGDQALMETRKTPVMSPDGKLLGVLGVARDITERKAIEKALRDSENMLQEAQRIAHVGSWDVDIVNDQLIWSDELFRIWEIDKTSFKADFAAFLETVHPEDRERVQRRYNEAVASHTLYEVEHRLLFPDGRVKHILERGEPQYDAQGKPVRFIGTSQDITERRRLEEALIKRESEFRSLADNVPDNIARWDTQGRYLYVNPTHERLLGMTLEELVGQVIPESHEQVKAGIRQVAATGQAIRATRQVLVVNGAEELHDVSLVPEFNASGNVVSVLGIGRNMTDIYRMQEAIANERATLRAFFEAMPDLAWMKDTEGRYLACNSMFELMFGATEAEIRGKTDFDFVGAELAAFFRQKDKEAEGAGQPCINEEWVTFASDGRRALLETVKSPVFNAEGKVIGVIGLAHDITERKRIEAELQEHGELLNAIMNSSPEIIVFALDKNYRYLSFNSKHRQVMQAIWGKEISVGMSMLDLIGSQQDRETAKEGFDRALAGESFESESAYGDEALSREYWQTFWSPIRANTGEVTGLTCFVLNVSERLRSEESLRRSERLMRAVIDATPDWIFVKDRHHRYRLVNKSYADSLRIPPEDFIGKDGLELGFPEEQVKGNPAKGIRGFWADDQQVLESNKAQMYPDHPVTVAGEVRTFHTIKVPLCDDDGMPWGVLALARDITERKQAEIQLLERYEWIAELNARLQENACTLEEQAVELEASKEQLMQTEAWYRGILQSAPDGMVVVDARGVIRLVNARLCHMFGYEDRELVGQSMELLVPLEMRNAHETLRAGFIESGVPGRPMTSGRGGLRGCRKDGSELYVDVSLARLPEMEGAMGTVCAAIRDVTERRRMEQALAKREQEFRTLVENSVDKVARYGRDLRRLYVNPAFAALVKGGAEALLGRTPAECPGGANAAMYENKLAEVFAEGRGTEFESKWVDSTGREMCSLINLTPEFDAQGQVVSVLSVGRDITELNAFRHRIHQMAFYDPLTSLPNRALFNDRLRQMITDAAWHGQQAGLMMMDMDRFKEVNDTLGHAAGDELLRETAARLSACVRAYDTVARLGGDEFAILLPEVRSGDDLGGIANKILALFEQPFLLEGKEVFVSCSIGIALYPGDSAEADDLLKYADSAMYFAKRSGRNNFRFYSRDLTESSHERLVLESDLRRAIEREELELYYQPKVNLDDGALTGSEALLRWKHPERGMVPPDVFIGIAEDSGLIVEIGEWVLREALRTACRWNGNGKPLHRVAVNLSVRQFQGGNLAGMVCRALEESGCRAEWIELEITESLLLDDETEVLDVLNGFRAMGISIAIDDFGTGYSALSYLARFPIGTLKIDRSFISSIETDTYRAELVKAILSIARCLGQQVVAEGVETQAQADFLRVHGCQVAQGYLYGKPMPVAEFERLPPSFAP